MQNKIAIKGHEYPLVEMSGSSGAYSYPFVIAHGLPVAAIECIYGEPSESHIKRAEMAIDTLKKSGFKYNAIVKPDMSGHLEITDDLLMRNEWRVRTFNFFGDRHLQIEVKSGQGEYAAFSIWCHGLCREIYDKLRNGKVNRHGQPHPPFDDFFFTA
ncbi:hypothetical protein VCHA53O466_140100 [Vibrio chagasii]|nr:hypothetical protein VCHA53O466_140100 [Vibrio chagasii]